MNKILTQTASWLTTGLMLLTLSCGQSSKQTPVTASSPDPVAAGQSPNSSLPDGSGKKISNNLNVSVLGIDVSHFQNDVNWEEVKKAKIRYMYTKATQGETDVDPRYRQNRAGAITAGLYHGAYHFYMAGDDPVKQADLFIRTVKPLNDNAIPPVLDLEQGGMTKNINTATYQENVLTWLTRVEAALGVRPIIYTDHPFGNQYLDNPRFARYQLWIAEYGTPEPHIPNTWKSKGWIMWQRTERGNVEGAIGNVDHDVFNGTDAGLDRLVTD